MFDLTRTIYSISAQKKGKNDFWNRILVTGGSNQILHIWTIKIENNWDVCKAELLQVGFFSLIHLFAWEIVLIEKLEIEETKTS